MGFVGGQPRSSFARRAGAPAEGLRAAATSWPRQPILTGEIGDEVRRRGHARAGHHRRYRGQRRAAGVHGVRVAERRSSRGRLRGRRRRLRGDSQRSAGAGDHRHDAGRHQRSRAHHPHPQRPDAAGADHHRLLRLPGLRARRAQARRRDLLVQAVRPGQPARSRAPCAHATPAAGAVCRGRQPPVARATPLRHRGGRRGARPHGAAR